MNKSCANMSFIERMEYLKNTCFEWYSGDIMSQKSLYLKCKDCGYIFQRDFKTLFNGTNICINCDNFQKRKIIEDYNYEVFDEGILKKIFRIKCKTCGIIKTTSFTNLKKHPSCPNCKSIEQNNLLFESKKWKVLNRINGILKISCSNGHILEYTFNDAKKVKVCPICKKEETIQKIPSYWTLIKYLSSKNVVVTCPKGHIKEGDLKTLKHCFCETCNRENKEYNIKLKNYSIISRDKNHYTIKCNKCGDIQTKEYNSINTCNSCELKAKKHYSKLRNFTFLSQNSNIVTLKCDLCNIILNRNWNSFKSNKMKCPNCNKILRENYAKQHNHNIIKNVLSNKPTLQCNICKHVYEKSWGDFYTKGYTKCPNCFPLDSGFELNFEKLIPKNTNYIKNDWSVLWNRELDFYFPDHNLAVECNGDYWHSEQFGKDESYHNDKTNRCKKKGIELWHIWESDFYKNKNEWADKLQQRLSKVML